MGPDLSEIKIEGNDAEVDSFVACITAAVKYWGRDYDYDYFAGLAGSAFSPVWHEAETCGAWWTEFGNDKRIRFLGQAVGFYVRESPEMSVEEYDAKGELKPELARFWKQAGEALQEGKVVLTGSWPCWSIITKWDEDISKLGLESVPGLGRVSCAPHPLAKTYVLTPGPAVMTRLKAIKEALKFGADIADGTFKALGFSYGGKLYDAILDRMTFEHFCGDCGGKSCNCVHRTMVRIAGVNRSAVRFLEFAGEFLGRQLPKPALDTVTRGYGKMAEIADSYSNRAVLCENWDRKDFKEEFASKVRQLHVTHRDMSKIFRRLSQSIV